MRFSSLIYRRCLGPLGLLILAFSIYVGVFPCAWSKESSQDSSPYQIISGSGPFRDKKVTSKDSMSDPKWSPIETLPGEDQFVFESPDRGFSIKFEHPKTDTGDMERFNLFIKTKQHKAYMKLGREFTAWAYITPDGRFIFWEPFFVLDFKNGKVYNLSKALGLPVFVNMESWAQDNKSFIVSTRACGTDCSPDNNKTDYYLIEIK